MTTPLRAIVDRLFAALEAKDVDAVLRMFAANATIVDPHYPVPAMRGKPAIEEGLRWAFGALRSMGFTIVSYCEAVDGRHAAVEVETAHVARPGTHLNFPQAFMIDADDGLITRVRAYTPYGPNGIGGLFLLIARLQRRITQLRQAKKPA